MNKAKFIALTRSVITSTSYIVEDTFTDSDTTALTAHTPDTGSSPVDIKIVTTALAPDNQINSNIGEARVASTGWVYEMATGDGTLNVTWKCETGAVANVVFRYSSDGNLWILNIRETAQDCRLIKYIANGTTVVHDDAKTFTNGVDYAIKVILSGNSISYEIDDVPVNSTSDAQWATETQHGLARAGGTAYAKWDNFTYE